MRLFTQMSGHVANYSPKWAPNKLIVLLVASHSWQQLRFVWYSWSNPNGKVESETTDEHWSDRMRRGRGVFLIRSTTVINQLRVSA